VKGRKKKGTSPCAAQSPTKNEKEKEKKGPRVTRHISLLTLVKKGKRGRRKKRREGQILTLVVLGGEGGGGENGGGAAFFASSEEEGGGEKKKKEKRWVRAPVTVVLHEEEEERFRRCVFSRGWGGGKNSRLAASAITDRRGGEKGKASQFLCISFPWKEKNPGPPSCPCEANDAKERKEKSGKVIRPLFVANSWPQGRGKGGRMS